MSHVDEYSDAMIAAMDLVWGAGFMAPGGEGHVDRLVAGLDLRGKLLLDIGCGQGRPACIFAGKHGAQVVGTDLEAHLLRRARLRAEREGLARRVDFQQVQPGPLCFADASFDCVVISGAMTQIEDKLPMYRECLRVLKPGGSLRCYDWMKAPGDVSDDMRYWFELEGLTYAMRTLGDHDDLLAAAGFVDVAFSDRSDWYRNTAHKELEQLQGPLFDSISGLLGADAARHFVENWRALTVILDKGEMLTVYSQASRPAAAT
jgi:phosphoethanolamine N-methyltransferase